MNPNLIKNEHVDTNTDSSYMVISGIIQSIFTYPRIIANIACMK